MKGKRYTTEDKIRILREADCGERTIQSICEEANISEVNEALQQTNGLQKLR